MNTECTQVSFEFQTFDRREITARFDAPAITSDAGGLLLRELDSKFGILQQFTSCFDNYRDPDSLVIETCLSFIRPLGFLGNVGILVVPKLAISRP